MRTESRVTSLSWIPSEAIPGAMKLPFELGIGHYDQVPPEVLTDLEELRAADRFRFANDLRAWIEVEDGRIVDHGYSGHGMIGSTTLRLAGRSATFAAVEFTDIQQEPEVGDGWVRFTQTAGGRTGAPMPRRVSRPPFIQIESPTAWTTLSLTIHTDGRSEYALTGASKFPRHWIYDSEGKLAAKSGLIDFKTWSMENFDDNTPWGGIDEPAVVAQIESALERQLSATIMQADKEPKIRKLKKGATLVEQGAWGADIYVLLDGLLSVEVNGEPVAQVGPGAIVGERALLEGGKRTSTLRALTACKVAVAAADDIDRDALLQLAEGHQREAN